MLAAGVHGADVDDVPDITPDEHLNRISYYPDWVRDGKLLPAAINSDDLKGRGFSLDRDFVLEEVIRQRAAKQMAANPTGRQEAYVSRFVASDVTGLVAEMWPEGAYGPYREERLLELVKSPVPAKPDAEPPLLENKAHCHVLAAKADWPPSLIKKIKKHLLPKLQNLLSLDEFLAVRTPEMPD